MITLHVDEEKKEMVDALEEIDEANGALGSCFAKLHTKNVSAAEIISTTLKDLEKSQKKVTINQLVFVTLETTRFFETAFEGKFDTVGGLDAEIDRVQQEIDDIKKAKFH